MHYRLWECWHCKITFVSKVRVWYTTNLSGEKRPDCPKCYGKASIGYPAYSVDNLIQ